MLVLSLLARYVEKHWKVRCGSRHLLHTSIADPIGVLQGVQCLSSPLRTEFWIAPMKVLFCWTCYWCGYEGKG